MATLVSQRTELAGRLSARRAQAKALWERGAKVDVGIEKLAAEAEALLKKRPTPLAQVAKLLEAYEAAVVAARG